MGKLFRGGLAVAGITASCAAIVAACTSDEITAVEPDGGSDGSAPTEAGEDSGGDASRTDGSLPQITPAKIIVVHAATDYGPNNPDGMVRVCYATKTATDVDFTLSPLPPLPHSKEADSPLPYPGIPIGTGGPFPSTGLPLEGLAIRPYIVSAKALEKRGVVGTTGIAASARCNTLLKDGFVPDGGFPDSGGAGALVRNKDYWQLADIPAGTFKNGKTYLLGIYGCTSDVDTSEGVYYHRCGRTADGKDYYSGTGDAGPGNLTIAVFEIDGTTTVAPDEIGAQAILLSTSYQAVRDLAAYNAFTPFLKNGSDAGPNPNSDAGLGYISADGGPNEMAVAQKPDPIARIKGFIPEQGYIATNEQTVVIAQDPSPNDQHAMPLNNAVKGQPSVQAFSEAKPSAAPLFVNGKTYTFVFVGDHYPPPGATAGVGATRVLHFLGFPNQFTPPSAN